MANLRHDLIRAHVATTHPDIDVSVADVIGPLKHASAMVEYLLAPVFETATLSSSEFDVLIHLRYADGPTIARRLASAMGHSAAALSKVLAKLERRNLVERAKNPADRRAAFVTITSTGVAEVDALLPRRLTVEADLLAAIPPERRADITAALTDLIGALERAAGRQARAAD